MEENQTKKISRDAPFFEPSRFKNFDDDLQSIKILIQPKLYIKCTSSAMITGLFKMETIISKKNQRYFILYLSQALCMCQSSKYSR